MDEFIGENNVGDQPTDATVTIKGASFTGVSAGGGISAISISGGTVTVATDGAVDSVEIVDPDGTIRVPEIAPVIPIHGETTSESIPVAIQETISGVTVSDAVFLGRTAGKGGAIYNNGGTLAIFNTFFCDNAAEEGGAIFTQDGALKIAGGTFRHASDTVRCIGGSSRMTLGGTICTAAQIYAENAIDFAPDTKIDIALGSGTTTTIIIGPRVAFLGNYDTAFANDGNFSLTVTLSAAQAAGKYLLADNAANFDKEVALCVDGTEIGAVTSGKVLTVDDRNYFLSKGNDDNVFLSVGDKIVENAGVVTVDGGTDTIAIGGVIYTGTGYSQVQIGQAFADKQTVAAQDATLSGFTVAGGKNFVGDAV
ncbi:MAG: hypothetical protein MJ016_08460, partial [Victivallaceae bacterium]|nr:hypothetical protein [Victivallaceae bacterium]